MAVNPVESGDGIPSEVTWRPTPEQIARSNLRRFMDRYGLSDYEALQRWSVEDVGRFWDAVSRDLELEWYEPYREVLDISAGIQWPRWWTGGRFNYVHNALDKHAQGSRGERDTPDKVALIWEGEEGSVVRLTYRELYEATNRCANALRALGIGKGDRVGLYLPMIPEVVIAQLAIGKLGAIYTPVFSGFGAEAVATRLQDCGAKLLITCDGYLRRNRLTPTKELADDALILCPTVEHVIVVSRAGRGDAPWVAGRDVWWHELVPEQSPEFETARTDPEDPYMIIYTSGTTGRPKGVLHVHGGFPIKGAQDMAHCFDVTADDTFFWLTDMGWMMGPWYIGGTLILGGRGERFFSTMELRTIQTPAASGRWWPGTASPSSASPPQRSAP
jgi:acetyl-CoA synthetase